MSGDQPLPPADQPVPLVEQPAIVDLLPRCRFPASGTEVVCAVSGGADSLSLLVLACAAGLAVEAVHVDHGLRPGSESEATTVEAAAARFGATFRSERAVVSPGPDLEARARTARQKAIATPALTGHTADDQAETVLVNLLRGTGLTGLAGMRSGGIHPLLDLRRADTHRLCADLGLDPVVDPSNDDPRFVRNRVRHELLPLLQSIGQRDPVVTLTRTASQARTIDDSLSEMAKGLDPRSTSQLQMAPPVLTAVALRRWLRDREGHPPSAAELDRVLDVVWHRRQACELRGGRRVARTEGILRIECADQ